MAGVDELDFDVRRHRHRAVVADRLQLRHCAERVRFGVQRQRGLVLREAVTVGVGRIFFLDPAGVGQHDAAEILGAGGAENAAAETLRHQPRQIAAMIEVRVRQDDRVDVCRGNRQVLPVALAQLLQPLEQPRVDRTLSRYQCRAGTSIRSPSAPRQETLSLPLFPSLTARSGAPLRGAALRPLARAAGAFPCPFFRRTTRPGLRCARRGPSFAHRNPDDESVR